MHVAILYESLTGNTARAAAAMGAGFSDAGVDVSVRPVTDVDHQALAAADLIVVGSWTDGALVVGQRPGRSGRLRRLPVLDHKRAVVYCTYALHPGRTLDKLSGIIGERGADVLGGLAIHRRRLGEGATDLVDAVLGEVGTP